MRELSVAEQRYQAVLSVIKDGRTVTETAAAVGVSRQTLHAWLAKYEAGGLEGLVDGSHRPLTSPQQMLATVEAAVLEARRKHPSWGPRRIAVEVSKSGPGLAVTESSVYRCLRRAGLVEPDGRRRRRRDWKRWERGRPNELWQMDVVGGFLLADGTQVKALTGVDDHSRFCVSARLMPRERTRPVCDGLTAAMRTYGVPEQILTDNGRVFTGKFFAPPVEVLFDRICRENGVQHLLTQPRSPTTTGRSSGSIAPCARSSTPAGSSPTCAPPDRRWRSGSSVELDPVPRPVCELLRPLRHRPVRRLCLVADERSGFGVAANQQHSGFAVAASQKPSVLRSALAVVLHSTEWLKSLGSCLVELPVHGACDLTVANL
jgi:transposase